MSSMTVTGRMPPTTMAMYHCRDLPADIIMTVLEGQKAPELKVLCLLQTELCRTWSATGQCRYGGKCQFAHGFHELRPVQRHPKYKTEVGSAFATAC